MICESFLTFGKFDGNNIDVIGNLKMKEELYINEDDITLPCHSDGFQNPSLK
ncbi:MAG TPA: hypothetical protein PKY56_01475 [Candidatus Kapabacteria bacterium]|nr:hypothetical protein [Candidatus Kapabacteria bacterium]